METKTNEELFAIYADSLARSADMIDDGDIEIASLEAENMELEKKIKKLEAEISESRTTDERTRFDLQNALNQSASSCHAKTEGKFGSRRFY
tara:strand:- start:241 stop:516 length:276 start_codon:yes stop_codon:yes gene_type:complete